MKFIKLIQSKKAQKEKEYEELSMEFERSEEIAKQIPRQLIPEVEDSLNHGMWHPALGDKPDGWDSMEYEKRRDATRVIYYCVHAKGSKKEFLRYHHIHNLGETDEQFEDWWDSHVLEEIKLAIMRKCLTIL